MNRREFTAEVEKTQGALRRFLCALCCGDTSLADDIAQETYIKAFLSSDGFRGDAAFSSWLFRIAVNTFVSHRRSFRPTVGEQALAEEPSQSVADDSFRYQALYYALARLSDNERTAIVLNYLEGYSTREIAQMTDSSEDNVRQRLSRGRLHLKQFLSKSSDYGK